MARAALGPQCLGRHAARDHALAEHALGADQRRDAGGDIAAGVILADRERERAGAQLRQDHAFQRLVVLGDDEVAQPLAHLRLDRRQPHVEVGLVGAA
ncbi:MAG TPA: hypothetical protein VK630_10415, partial [Reyranella sp.]|nr:hypothetical protein [Reyranella sp.]